MTIEQIKLKNIVEQAIIKFNNCEKYLLDNNLSERCICSKFAMYLRDEIKDSEFNAYIVDVEYNRGNNGICNNPKFLNNKNIVVDLIVHKRGYDETYGYDNLICIEMKKSNDSRGAQGIAEDEDRLRKLTNHQYSFNYQIGMMLVADIKNKNLKIKSEYYLD